MTRQRVRAVVLAVSGLLIPVTYYYLSPYLILQAGSEGIVGGSFVVFGIQFLSALVLGRAFCGWICPAGAVAEGASKLRDKPFRRRALDAVKYAVWLPWVGFVVFVVIRAGGLRYVDVGYQTWHGVSVSNVQFLVILLGLLCVLAGLTLWAGRRGFCHTVCWMAPFMIIGQTLRDAARLPGLRLQARTEDCVSCGGCTRACTMSLDVQGMVKRNDLSNRECILCARCADTCPKHVLSLAWRRRRDATTRGEMGIDPRSRGPR